MSVPIVRKKRKIICRNEDYYGKLYKAGYLPFSRRGRCRIYQTSVCRQFWSIEKYRDDGESSGSDLGKPRRI